MKTHPIHAVARRSPVHPVTLGAGSRSGLKSSLDCRNPRRRLAVWLALGGLCLALARANAADTTGTPSAGETVALVALGPATNLSSRVPEAKTWASGNPVVAEVVEGWVFGKRDGRAEITAQTKGGERSVFRIQVSPGRSLRPPPPASRSPMTFITRDGNQLLEDGKPFRFLSCNVPNLHIIEDASWRQLAHLPAGKEPYFWHRITPAEQEDAVQTVAQLGGQVIRCYTLSVQGGRRNATGLAHYTGPGAPLTEELMQDYDHMIAICGRHRVRLILPVIDEWDWFGGRHEFAKLSGGGDFYTDRKVIGDFKDLIARLVNRVNTVTGVAYKEDPTILAWETGNELQRVPRAWTEEIAAWLKTQAPKQLVADGANGSLVSLDDPNIDLVTDHFYGGRDFINRAMRSWARMGAKKVFYIGEYGCTDSDVELGTMDATLQNGLTGALLWSLRFHSADGGFYWHDEGGRNSAYHWPGFASNARSDEIHLLHGLREKAWAIRGFLPPPIQSPGAPVLLPHSTCAAISWLGGVGAESYELERSPDGKHWTPVAAGLLDCAEPFQPYADQLAPAVGPVFYRMRAVNSAGRSAWSEMVKLRDS